MRAARRLTALGAPTGAAIEVATESGRQECSKVAVSPDGTFSVVWADPAAASKGEEDVLHAARYEADGDLASDFARGGATRDYQLDPERRRAARTARSSSYTRKGPEESVFRRAASRRMAT